MGSSATESYTEMGRVGGDVEAIGKHCQYCRQLDFLPFRCESCRGTYCLEHRTETAHECPKRGEWARRRNAQNASTNYTLPPKLTSANHDRQCLEPKCRTLIDTPLNPGNHCTTCNRHYCLKHRMEEDHDCKNLTPIGARPQNTAKPQAVMSLGLAVDKLRQKYNRAREQTKEMEKEKLSEGLLRVFGKVGNRRNETAAQLKATNELKRAAKGDSKTPPEKRVYLHVEASADTTRAKYPTGKFFYNKDWTVGKVLDAAAKALQVENVNNRGGGEEAKLRIFHVKKGRLLNFGEKLGSVCKDGELIILLRGVGDPDLMDVGS